jgi:NAD+ synthase (glutamine-hydrolysing)
MRTLRLALAQINSTVGDLAGNVRKMVEYIGEAKARAADIVVFPELALCGYPPEDLLLKPAFIRACGDSLEKLAVQCYGLAAIVGFPEEANDLYNAAAILCDGKIIGTCRKQLLPNYGVFDEDRYFAPAHGQSVLVTQGGRIGVSICEDIWHPGGPHEVQAVIGNAELLINISASPYHRGKGKSRERMLAVRASDSVAALAFCNLVGGQDELVFDGRSAVFDPTGTLVARGKQFHEDLVVADVDLDEVTRRRLHDPRRRKGQLQKRSAEAPVQEVFLPIPCQVKRAPLTGRSWAEPLSELEEIYEALILGTRDYVKKNGFDTVVLGLSGGVDSTLVACIAADALGADHVVGVSMPSRYSSDHSRTDAAQLTCNLGIRYLTIPIEPAFGAFSEMLAPALGGWSPDLTEENLQSRIRGTVLMALSNKFGWLVVTTGNKSENSVGYTTLYGDMAGGFAVIKDVPKTLVYELSRFRNTRSRVITESILLKPPSAELRPNQKDTDSLPEYADLDPLLAAYVEQDWSIAEMIAAGFDPSTVSQVVKLVDRSEYKRRQAPPGIKITPRAFGKDRRLPITNRFREEGS